MGKLAILATVVALGGGTAPTVAPLALWHMPTAWGYTLDGGCYWRPRPWARALGPMPPPARPDRIGRRDEWRCLHERGLKSMVIFHEQVLPSWPSPASFARWENEERADGYSPPAQDWAIADPAIPQ